jgi:hypothetical protein
MENIDYTNGILNELQECLKILHDMHSVNFSVIIVLYDEFLLCGIIY